MNLWFVKRPRNLQIYEIVGFRYPLFWTSAHLNYITALKVIGPFVENEPVMGIAPIVGPYLVSSPTYMHNHAAGRT